MVHLAFPGISVDVHALLRDLQLQELIAAVQGLVSHRPELKAALLQDWKCAESQVEAAQSGGSGSRSASALFPAKQPTSGLFAKEETSAGAQQSESLKLVPTKQSSVPPGGSPAVPQTPNFGVNPSAATTQASGSSNQSSTLFPPKSSTTADSPGGLFPAKSAPSAASAQPSSNTTTNGNSGRSLFPAAAAAPASAGLFPAAAAAPAGAPNVQVPRMDDASGSASSALFPAGNVQTPPVAQGSASAVIDTTSAKPASQLKNVFEKKAQDMKKGSADVRRKSWTPRHHELDLPDGQGKATFRAHDAPYQARTSFGAPVREKKSLSELLKEDKLRAESQ